MALQAAIATDSNLQVPDAYLRVEDLRHVKVAGVLRLEFKLAYYADKAGADAGVPINAPLAMSCVYGMGDAYSDAYGCAKEVYTWATDG